jgi:phosphonate transport system permease protein
MSRLFDPEATVEIAKRHSGLMRLGDVGRRYMAGIAIFAFLLLCTGLVQAEFSMARMIAGAGRLGDFATLMVPPEAGPNLKIYVFSMIETLGIALLGTVIAASLAFPMAVLASRNVLPIWIIRFFLRRSFDTIRGVETLIWALIWISAVGMGPFAGVLAMATSDFGAFAKIFAETIESADQRPVEGIRSTGGTMAQEFRFGILPQVLPVMAGQVLYYFESNTRSATIIGIVGAGGIGLHLSELIRTLEWQQVSFIVMMILVVVAAIDFGSSRLRQMIGGQKPI